MSILVLLEATAKADQAGQLMQFLKERLPETRQFEGCQDLVVYANADNPLNAVFVEHWDSKDAYQKYFEWRTETGVIARLLSYLDGAPSIRYFDAADV